jgi:hypothetical protein
MYDAFDSMGDMFDGLLAACIGDGDCIASLFAAAAMAAGVIRGDVSAALGSLLDKFPVFASLRGDAAMLLLLLVSTTGGAILGLLGITKGDTFGMCDREGTRLAGLGDDEVDAAGFIVLGDEEIDACGVLGGVPDAVLPMDMSACRLAAAAAAAGVRDLLLSSVFALELGFFGVVLPDDVFVAGDGGFLGDCGMLAGLGEEVLCAPAAPCGTFCTDHPSVGLLPTWRALLSSLPSIPNRGLPAGPAGLFPAVVFCTAHPPCGTLP